MTTVGRLMLSALCLALVAEASSARERQAASNAGQEASLPRAEKKVVPSASPSQEKAAPAAEPQADTSSLPSGYVVHRDPDTGAFTTPSASDMAKLGAANRARLATREPVIEQTGVKGGTMVHLHGRFRNYMTLQVGKDGHVESNCTQNEEKAHVAH